MVAEKASYFSSFFSVLFKIGVFSSSEFFFLFDIS
jgi:hypothetical protein